MNGAKTLVRLQRADAVRAKLAELDLSDDDLAAAVAWVRRRSTAQADPRVAQPKGRYRAGARRGKKAPKRPDS